MVGETPSWNRPRAKVTRWPGEAKQRLVDGKTSEKYPTSRVSWTEWTSWSIPQAESRGRKGRLGVSHKQSLVDGKDVLEYPTSRVSWTERTRKGRFGHRTSRDQEEAKPATVLPLERRKAIRGTFTRIINEINGEFEKSQIDRNDIYSKFNRLESYYTKLVDLNEKYQALLVVKEGITEESIDREWQECDKYEEEKFDIQQKVSVLRNPDKEETIPIASEDTVINVKLPELALKSYDGSLEGWLPWWAQFSKIHENKNLSDSDRFLYLRQAIVPNSEAYRVVASYPVTGANYALAVQALQERFGDPNILTELYVRRLLNSVISNVKKENRNLSSLYDELSSHLRSLETLGIDPQLSGIFLYPLVESSLPSDILKIWHRHPSSGYGMELAKREESDKGVGGAQERLRLLLDFLKAEVRSAQRLKFVEKGFKQEEPYKRSYNDGTRTRSNFRPATVSSLFGGRTNIKCFFCERTNHASHQCRSIMKMSPGERNDKIRSAHLCFKCLRKGHIQSQCREQLECKNCGRNHLEVLCEGNSSNRLTKPGRENLKENAPEPIASLSSQACTGLVLLMTTVALLKGPNASRRVRILLDSGSQFSYIKQSLVWSIGIERKGEITIAKSLFGGNKIGEEKHGKFMLELENLGNKRDVIHIEALDQRKICDAIPPLPKGDWLEKLKIKGIILSQDNFKGQEIDILIGANYLGMILTGKIVQVEADLTAVETKLGWTLMGNSPIIDSNDNVQQTLNLLTTRCDLKDLWDLEVLGIRDPVETCSKETRYEEIKEKFITKIQRQSDQRYSVGLPWKVEKESIPSNLDIAIKRLDISTKKMTSQNKLTEYSQVFRDWLTEGLIERVEENPLERRGYYLPPRPVYKMESKTTPIRPVFDASCLGHNGLSLNQCLEKGPNLLERIPEMMIRFRENKFGVTADIRKAFQMVAIEESERNYLRFLWWEKESDRELIAYRHKRLVFGLNCSPFVLNAVIEYHLQSIRGPLVQWAKILAQSFYMDNCITSLETKQEVQEFQKAAIEIMDRAKMDLREWEYSLEENPEKGTCTKILGVVWNKMEDSLKCELPDNLSLQPKLTKRLVLSMVQRIFDPLGFCAPVFLPPKLLLQRSWGLKLGWDTPLPESMAQEFRTWLDQIKFIELIKIPRYMWNDLIFPTEVHIFCDASQIGYGAVAYLRSETGRENTLTLIWSKVRLAPMKSITIPRLELMAMVLGARLANAIQAALKRKCETTLWSDSTTALSWIKKEIEWRVVVRNRVREIQATTNLNDWRFVPSQLNPADLLSRGCPPSQFVQSRWWEGPEWLKKPKEFWLNSEIMSYVLRFLGKLKKQSTETGPLKVSELDLAEKKLIRMIQEKVSIEKSNATKSFKILKNTDGLWCVESKLLHGQVPEEFKTPIILPGDHPFVEQLIWEVHLKNGHVGVQFILSNLREKFWIIRGRKTIKKIISKCIACKRLKEKSLQRPMAALPENRIGLGKPFQITGVDLLGPLHLKEGGKVWVAAFTCAVYRAIHLELVKSLETGVFMMALHRIQWIFIPPSAPWWGGFWERMVRTIKEMLIKMLGHRKLKYVQLQTALCEIESIINNRPLTYVSEDDNDLKPLTPNEFLQNGPESSFPEFENLKPEMLHTRYRELGQLKRELEQRFLKEYLGALIQKSENIDRRQLKVGDVVLIGQENLKRMFRPKGRIVNLIPGKDGIVRVAHVKTSTGTLIRALQRLHPLEISSNVETIQKDNSNTEPQSEAFLGNRPNTESRDSRSRYGRVIRKPARRPRSIPQAESRGRNGRLEVSHKQSLVDGKDVLEYPTSRVSWTERTRKGRFGHRTSRDQEEAKPATVLPLEMIILTDPNGGDPSDVLRSKRSQDRKYIFDAVFNANSSQEEVYRRTTEPLVDNVLNGFNGTVFAYGATGSGKTYTMVGTEKEPGIMVRALRDIFGIVSSLNSCASFHISMSYLEVYNENIRDLLNPGSGPLDLREDSRGHHQVVGLSEEPIRNANEVMSLLSRGNRERTQESTGANCTSSRSHALLVILVRRGDAAAAAALRVGKLCMVDLAGSERAAHTQNTGKRLVEGAHINKSLLALGNCINALAERGVRYVNFRDSKLTRLLKETLSGNCRTVMVAHVSPSGLHVEESRNTLVYADRAKNITNKVHSNVRDVTYHVAQYQTIISELRSEITRLQDQLEQRGPSADGEVCHKLTEEEMESFKQDLVQAFQQQMESRTKLLELDSTLMSLSSEHDRILSALSQLELESKIGGIERFPVDLNLAAGRGMVIRNRTWNVGEARLPLYLHVIGSGSGGTTFPVRLIDFVCYLHLVFGV
ncbi:hypothetical protein LAZ67_14000274 [Cordylochernes scorpioides]|uniref:Uncharacterized protein n=1 Tax=Cordylochernes scorpioides TaxID=51811 RepID=A0ABY6L5J0_9ARAC|nr:hypothetical protein LAZ67_14000274 [Cordylochernes scorpioides]